MDEERENRRCRRAGELLASIDDGVEVIGLDRGVLTGFRVRLPTEEEPSVLLLVRASDERGKHIAFVGAYGVVDALLAWRARRTGDGLKWREDVPWKERKAGA